MLRLPILVLLAAAALVAGCGGDDDGNGGSEGVPPADWAQTVCGALSDWQISLQEQSQSLSGTVLEAGTPQAAKDQISEFLANVIADTESMIGTVEDAGDPAVDRGGEIANDFQARLLEMRTAFQDAQREVEDVPTNDPQAFQQELTEIGEELQTQGEAIGNRLDEIDERYDADELSEAFDATPACEDFAGTGE